MANSNDPKTHHHILPVKTALLIGAALLFLTFITVWVAGFDFGRFNTLIAVLIASVKASLVVLFFMNLYYDNKENMVIFGSSFLFLAIFGVLTATDLWFRGDVYLNLRKNESVFRAVQGQSKFSKPWVATPEILANGKTLFQAQCAMCHGAEGMGNGPAGGGLPKPPRNFHETAGWVNGRTRAAVFKTLTQGIPAGGMPSFSTLPAEDRWSLAHYVLSLGPEAPPATDAELKTVGVDPNQAGGGAEAKAPEIPVDFAIERMAVDHAQ